MITSGFDDAVPTKQTAPRTDRSAVDLAAQAVIRR
jgi:hypothetical protein